MSKYTYKKRIVESGVHQKGVPNPLKHRIIDHNSRAHCAKCAKCFAAMFGLVQHGTTGWRSKGFIKFLYKESMAGWPRLKYRELWSFAQVLELLVIQLVTGSNISVEPRQKGGMALQKSEDKTHRVERWGQCSMQVLQVSLLCGTWQRTPRVWSFFPNEKYTKKLVDVWYPRQVYQVLLNFPKPRKSYEWCSGADFPLGASRPPESIRICPRKLWVNHKQAVYNSLGQ